MLPRARLATVARVAALAAAAALAVAPVPAQHDFGRSTILVEEPTDAGTWNGSWYYVSRDYQVGLWFRGEPQAPELKLRLTKLATGEGFETDWTGVANYRHDGKPGEMSISMFHRDANRIEGDWNWRLGRGELARTEVAKLTLYRTADGRSLTMHFEGLERSYGGPRPVRLNFPQVWSFAKASSRLVLWEELPF
jgi:hypothetical protein